MVDASTEASDTQARSERAAAAADRGQLTASTTVALPPSEAFRQFVEHMGEWWPLPYTYAEADLAEILLEPHPGGRWAERDRRGLERRWGEVRRFEWGSRLVLAFAVSAQRSEEPPERESEVEIRFIAERGGDGPRTRVDLQHRHLEKHAEGTPTLVHGMSRGWPVILAAYTRHCDALADANAAAPGPPRALGRARPLRRLGAFSFFFVALAWAPAAAHLFEMPNKLGLAPEAYMQVQQIYRGWALFGLVVIPALVLTLSYALALYWRSLPYRWALAAFVLLALGHFVFWRYTYPMNVLTQSWTVLPAGFERARLQWELSHALNALLSLAALMCLWKASARSVASAHGLLESDREEEP